MKLESVGLLISLRPFNERDAVAHIFTREHGVVAGMLRGAVVTKTNKPLAGQVGNATWGARLDSALGVFHWESEKNLIAPIMIDLERIKFVNCVFDLIKTLLPEREAYPTLYDTTVKFITDLPHATTPHQEYLNWETILLREMGFALDLTKCSGCGAAENLTHISPKTGRAVCAECAAPYISRLYQLPLTTDTTFKFLEKICIELGAKIPNARITLTHEKNS